MTDWLKRSLTTLAFCWRLERRDGIVLGFTSHDRDLVIDDLPYRATPGMVPSAIARSTRLEADNVDLSGLVTADAITADDLALGRWDGARLAVFAVDWTAPTLPALPLVRGTLGRIAQQGAAFTATLLGPSTVLDLPVVEETSPDCRAELGDARCRVDLRGRVQRHRVVQVQSAALTLESPVTPNLFAFGSVRWIEGPLAGLRERILSNTASQLHLARTVPMPVASGTRVELVEGCDRTISTCAARFGNAVNFRGEPHLPGNDLLARYVV